MRKLSANGGNYIRLWLSNPFFDVEHAQSGVYDEEKAKRIDAVLALARKYNIRVKMTLEHFRHLGDGKQTWAGKPIYHVSQGGPAKDIADFFANPASREQFKKKLDWYAKRYGDDPTIFAWELWNEFDAVQDMWKPEAWQEGGLALDWTRVMLDALHQRFPEEPGRPEPRQLRQRVQDGDLPDLLPDPEQRPRPSAPLSRPGGEAGGLSRADGRSGRRRRADPARPSTPASPSCWPRAGRSSRATAARSSSTTRTRRASSCTTSCSRRSSPGRRDRASAGIGTPTWPRTTSGGSSAGLPRP